MFSESLTDSENKIVAVLLDGKAHPLVDFQVALDDPLFERNTLRVHVTRIRVKLKPGFQLDCVRLGYSSRYKLSRKLVPDHV